MNEYKAVPDFDPNDPVIETIHYGYCGSCGQPENEPHMYRHIYQPESLELKRILENGKHTVVVDASTFPTSEKNGKCTFFFPALNEYCGKDEQFHNSGITLSHEFKCDKTNERVVKIRVPADTKCRSCDIPLSAHANVRHKPYVELQIENAQPYDVYSCSQFLDSNIPLVRG